MLEDCICEVLQTCPRWIVSNDSQAPGRKCGGQVIIYSENFQYLHGEHDWTGLALEPRRSDGCFRLEEEGTIVRQNVTVWSRDGYPTISFPGTERGWLSIIERECPPVFMGGAVLYGGQYVPMSWFASPQGAEALRTKGLHDEPAMYSQIWFPHGNDGENSRRHAYGRLTSILPMSLPHLPPDNPEVLSALFPQEFIDHFSDKLFATRKVLGGYAIDLK